MANIAQVILEKMNPEVVSSGPEISGFGISNCFANALIRRALEEKITVSYKYASGFMSCSVDKLIKKLPFYCHKLFESDGMAIYTTSDSYIQFGTDCIDIAGPAEDDVEAEIEEKSISIYMASCSEKEIKAFDIIEKNISKDKRNVIYALSQTEVGLRLLPVGDMTTPIVKENYDDKVMESYSYVVENFNKRDPNGRLVVVYGEPGTGKTYLIRGLINDLTNCMPVIIPARMVPDIDGPSLIPLFVQHRRSKKKPIVMIIEDADACLAPRGSDNISAISVLLNNTDGILGTILDLRVIATTNQPKLEFDKALMRPGRLCRSIAVDLLDAKKANEIYRRVSKKDEGKYTDEVVSLADVYSDASGATVEKEPKKKGIGFAG